MPLKGKALIDAHYGKAPEYSYFNGCSTGGRQGLMEAQRFPDDFNGIISGAPVNRFTNLHMGQLWTAHATLKKPGAVLTRDDLTKVNAAVLAQCDAADGVKDGMLSDPRTCKFDPSSVKDLKAEQVEALKMIYKGAVNPRTGAQIYPGLEVGGEGPQPNNPGWGMIMNGKDIFGIDAPVLGGMGFNNPKWDWKTFDFDKDVGLVNAKLLGTLNAINPDLSDFKKHGGKLIVYHGWSDPGVMPQNTLEYVASVREFAGKSTGGDGGAYTDEYMRLYMLPGVGHCRHHDRHDGGLGWGGRTVDEDRVVGAERVDRAVLGAGRSVPGYDDARATHHVRCGGAVPWLAPGEQPDGRQRDDRERGGDGKASTIRGVEVQRNS
jgi:feruloyl esterase